MGLYDILQKHNIEYNKLVELINDLRGCVDFDAAHVVRQLDEIYDDKMTIEMICNNKSVIVRHKTKWYLFSYGTLILSWDCRTNKLWRHFKNSELVSQTTSRHIHEFFDRIPKYFEYKNIKQFVMNLKYKEAA